MIKRLLLSFAALALLLSAKEYDPTVIAIQAKLFPKIALLEQHVRELGKETLEIVVYAIEEDQNAALRFKNAFEAAYAEGIAGRTLVVSTSRFTHDTALKPDAIVVLAHNDETLGAIASWANRHQIISFTYDPFLLDKGFVASVYFGKSAQPYLNPATIRDYGFVFDHYLLKLSKFYRP